MGYFQVRYDSRVVIYDRRGFIRLATDPHLETLNEKNVLNHRSVDLSFLRSLAASAAVTSAVKNASDLNWNSRVINN